MNTNEIELFLSSNSKISKVPHGVFAADMLPKEKIKILPQMFVVNTCTSEVKNFSNCHWICLHIKSSVIEYFDSSGDFSFLTNVHIANFVLAQQKKIVFSCQQIQDVKSQKCGYFCLSFLYYVGFYVDFKTFMKAFDYENLALNDEIVMKLFKDGYNE